MAERMQKLAPWFHRIDLGGGLSTPRDPVHGAETNYPANLWALVRSFVPTDLRGRRALDVGCNAGFFCVELSRLGAAVTGLESSPHFLEQARLVRELLGLDLDLRPTSLYDVGPELGTFDVTLCLGVLYHLKHPLIGLERLAAVTSDLLVIESAIVAPGTRPPHPDYGGPAHELLFIEGPADCLEGLRNWFVPTVGCLRALLRTVGFRHIVAERDDGQRAIIAARR